MESENLSLESDGSAKGNLGQLSSSAQALIMANLNESDEIIYVEKPKFWRSNATLLIFAVLGTVGCIVAVVLASNAITQLLIGFPLVLAFAVIGGALYHRRRFYVLTREKVIIHPGMGDLIEFKYSTLISVDTEFNPLFCMREIVIKRKKPKSDFPKQEFISGLDAQVLRELELFLRMQIRTDKI
eukprot:TRINITY_DN9471_c0_g1_i1.p1 TRINITY_DN9471_c0_g1~~TRINITY_DN9471_c0_g1_i1.p1  ORF type:complete len:185 (-),score=39.98 TRINITY_DN9471_c0_g1_i1:49-603(-)